MPDRHSIVPTADKGPLVTIGMPIYNEERYLEHALDSLRAQDYENFEILISDNASTDASGEIGLRAATTDNRISYSRTDGNIGSAANFRRVAELAEGKYFMWAAGHDEWSKDLISSSVAALEANDNASIAIASSHWIDADGARDDRDTDYPDTRNMSLFSRFFTVFWGNMHPVLSVMRQSYLKQTRSMQSFAGADLVLLSELILMGDFVQAPNAYWHRRDIRTRESHHERLQRYTGKEYGQVEVSMGRRFPLLRLPFALINVICRASISWTRKTALMLAMLPMLPLRYVVGRRKANKK